MEKKEDGEREKIQCVASIYEGCRLRSAPSLSCAQVAGSVETIAEMALAR